MQKYIIAIASVFLLSCEDIALDSENQVIDKMYFEVEHENHAWGYFYQGIMVDQDGGVFSYNPAQEQAPVLFNSDGYYTEQELQSKYRHIKTYLKLIPLDSLRWACNQAKMITINNFSDTARVGADMGATKYSAYIYRIQNSKYQQVLLRCEGDFLFYNKSVSAASLTDWLKKL